MSSTPAQRPLSGNQVDANHGSKREPRINRSLCEDQRHLLLASDNTSFPPGIINGAQTHHRSQTQLTDFDLNLLKLSRKQPPHQVTTKGKSCPAQPVQESVALWKMQSNTSTFCLYDLFFPSGPKYSYQRALRWWLSRAPLVAVSC